MRSRIDGLIRLVVLHLAIACVASVVGSVSAPAAPSGKRMPGLVWEEAGQIYSNNLRALVVLAAAGAVFAGVAGMILFALNGYLFGQILVVSDAPLTGLWLFAPLELASFAVGAAAAMRIGLETVRWLRHGVAVELAEFEQFAVAVGFAGAGLATAAVLEGFAIRWAWTP